MGLSTTVYSNHAHENPVLLPEETAVPWTETGKSEGAASLSGDGALGASPGPTLLFQGGPQEEAETQASVLGEEGRVGEGALEVGNDH